MAEKTSPPWRRRALAGAIVVGLAAVSLSPGSFAAFSSATSNQNNQVGAGSVAIQDNDGGNAMFSLSGMKPGTSDSACIRVTYTGSLPASVRLHGTTSGSGLASHASVVITRGSFGTDPGYRSCTGFTPDTGTYVQGQSAGVVYAGTLEDLPASWAAGLVDPVSSTPESWTTGESHVYKFVVTLGDNAAARGTNAGQIFRWEAQSG